MDWMVPLADPVPSLALAVAAELPERVTTGLA